MESGIHVRSETLEWQDEASSPKKAQLVAEFELASNHALFDGHFDAHPVFPGVGQVELVLHLVGRALGHAVNLKAVGRCKFSAILSPDKHLCMKIDVELSENDEGGAAWTLADAASDKPSVYSRGRLTYGTEGAIG